MEGGRLKRIAFACLLVAGVVGFAEALAAVAYHLVLDEHTRTTLENTLQLRTPREMNSTLRFRAHPFLNYAGNPQYRDAAGVAPFVAPGIRGPAAATAGALRIVALGGSTTFGQFVPETADVWPARAGRLLSERLEADVTVVNAALPGYSTYNHLAIASLWLSELDADLVLIHCGFNDGFYAAFPDEGGADGTGYDRPWSTAPLPPSLRTAMRVSHLARVLFAPGLRRQGRLAGDIFTAAHHPPPADDEEVVRNASAATGRYYRRNLETLIALVRHAGAQPVLVNMPLNPTRLTGFGTFYDVGFAATRRNNLIMAEVASAADVVVVDLASQIVQPEVFIDPVHVNEAGHARKATLVAASIEPLARSLLASP